MAAAPQLSDDGNKKGQSASLIPFLGALAGLSVVAAAGGGFVGLQLYARVEKTVQHKIEAADNSKQAIKATVATAVRITPLPTVITNLADPPTTWVRLDASLVLDGEPPADIDLTAAKFSEDIVAFLRTVSLAQIEGATGFQHLREDLADRVRARSGGRVRELVIHTFIVE